MVNTRSNDHNALLNVLIGLAVLCLLALLSACGGGPPPERNSTVPLSTAVLRSGPDSMHVYDSTYQRIRSAFDKNFSLAVSGPIQQVEQELDWTSLEARMARLTGQRALRFEYGLRNDSFVVALVPLELDSTPTPGIFTYVLPDSVYALENGALIPALGEDWRKDRQFNVDDSSVYFSRVMRENEMGVPQLLDHATDARACVMAWDEELQVLYDENKSGHGDSTFQAVFRCISNPDASSVLQHGMCVVLRVRAKDGSGHRDLLDNSWDKDHPFHMHGADFGNMVPPGINIYQLGPR